MGFVKHPASRRSWQVGGATCQLRGEVGRLQAQHPSFAAKLACWGRNLNVLIQGESGTGKEVTVKAIYCNSGLAGQLVSVNCAALPPDLVESELFGHERGSFTGQFE